MTDQMKEDIKQGRRQIDELVADLRSQVTTLQTELTDTRRPVEDGEVASFISFLNERAAYFAEANAAEPAMMWFKQAADLFSRLTQELAEAKAERDKYRAFIEAIAEQQRPHGSAGDHPTPIASEARRVLK